MIGAALRATVGRNGRRKARRNAPASASNADARSATRSQGRGSRATAGAATSEVASPEARGLTGAVGRCFFGTARIPARADTASRTGGAATGASRTARVWSTVFRGAAIGLGAGWVIRAERTPAGGEAMRDERGAGFALRGTASRFGRSTAGKEAGGAGGAAGGAVGGPEEPSRAGSSGSGSTYPFGSAVSLTPRWT
jgi:hypothetical protein